MIDEKTILELINEADPVSLAPGFATPNDEYALEAKHIVNSLEKSLSESELAAKLEAVFTEFFSEELAKNNPKYPENYRILAREIKSLVGS